MLLLFNLVLDRVFKHLVPIRKHRKYGTVVESLLTGAQLTHVMFADDTTLLASSRKSLILMLKETKQALEEHGLRVNAGKCQGNALENIWASAPYGSGAFHLERDDGRRKNTSSTTRRSAKCRRKAAALHVTWQTTQAPASLRTLQAKGQNSNVCYAR